jgi:hypothetical protein
MRSKKSVDGRHSDSSDIGLNLLRRYSRRSRAAPSPRQHESPRSTARRWRFWPKQCRAAKESLRCELKRGHHSQHAARTLEGVTTWTDCVRPRDGARLILDWARPPLGGGSALDVSHPTPDSPRSE